MLIATKDLLLPTTVTGSWPRPSWFTGNLFERPFSSAMADVTYREHFVDAVGSVLNDQELAGLDILTNGDYHLDADIGGRSWFSYPSERFSGMSEYDTETTFGWKYPIGSWLNEIVGGWKYHRCDVGGCIPGRAVLTSPGCSRRCFRGRFEDGHARQRQGRQERPYA